MFNNFVYPNMEQDILDIMCVLKKESKRFHEFQILKDIVYSFENQSDSSCSDIVKKVYNFFMDYEITHDTRIIGDIFSVNNFENFKLTFEERNELKIEMERCLKIKSQQLFEKIQQIGMEIDAVHNVFGDSCEWTAIDLKTSLNSEAERCVYFLIELLRLYEELLKIKCNNIPSVITKVIERLQMNVNLIELKTDILDIKTKLDVITEFDYSLKIFPEILNHVFQETKKCQDTSSKLLLLKENYKQVSCKQYNEILENYLQYKSRIEKKQMFYKHVNN